jgi:hypothetical protein
MCVLDCGQRISEFAREIIKRLEIYDEADTKVWFEMFKHGISPK